MSPSSSTSSREVHFGWYWNGRCGCRLREDTRSPVACGELRRCCCCCRRQRRRLRLLLLLLEQQLLLPLLLLMLTKGLHSLLLRLVLN